MLAYVKALDIWYRSQADVSGQTGWGSCHLLFLGWRSLVSTGRSQALTCDLCRG